VSRAKRIAAKEEKERLAAEKRAITVAKILGPDKAPLSLDTPPVEKKPVEVDFGGGNFAKLVEMSSEKEDRADAWSWKVNRDWHPDPGNGYITAFTDGYHLKKTWSEVQAEKTTGKGGVTKLKHVYYPVSAIVSEARKRLAALKMDDYEDIFRFRMSNLERLYGFVVGATFIIVWYDPKHDICPAGV
jgi:hypothetical protein